MLRTNLWITMQNVSGIKKWNYEKLPINFAMQFPFPFPVIKTNSQIRDTVLCRSVTKNLTDYRFNSAGWGLNDMKGEIHSLPAKLHIVRKKYNFGVTRNDTYGPRNKNPRPLL